MARISELIKLYNEGGLTQHVLEKEISEYLGDRYICKIEDEEKAMTACSYFIFLIPEVRINGLFINVIIDKDILLSYYNDVYFDEILDNIKTFEQPVLRSFNILLKKRLESDRADVIRKYLEIYDMIRPALIIEETPLIVREEDLESIFNQLDSNEKIDLIIETLKTKRMVPETITTYLENFLNIDAEENIIHNEFNADIPNMNIVRTSIASFCNGKSIDYKHEEIPFDYLPSTNQ